MIYDGMQYDPIQGQGHEPFKVGKSNRFQKLTPFAVYNWSWQLTTDS